MKIFIGFSASEDINYDYYKNAKEVAEYLSEKYELVCGANTGMAKEIVNIFKRKDKVEFVTLDIHENEERGEVYSSSMDRLKELYSRADLILIMPGGIGTLSELFGSLEEIRSYKNKKIVLYNYKNYYDELISFIKKSRKEGFITDEDYKLLRVINNIEEI